MAATRIWNPGAACDKDLEAQERELQDRLIATAAGLPRICWFKICRRRKRCFGATPECLRLHSGLARARFESALKKLGWPNIREDGSPLDEPARAAALDDIADLSVIPGPCRRHAFFMTPAIQSSPGSGPSRTPDPGNKCRDDKGSGRRTKKEARPKGAG